MSLENKKIEKHYNGLINEIKNELLLKISNDYKLNIIELKEKYINNSSEKKQKRYKKISGYNLFLGCEEINKKIRDENTNTNFSQVSKLKGSLWSNMTDKEKKEWNNKAFAINKQREKKLSEEFTFSIN